MVVSYRYKAVSSRRSYSREYVLPSVAVVGIFTSVQLRRRWTVGLTQLCEGQVSNPDCAQQPAEHVKVHADDGTR